MKKKLMIFMVLFTACLIVNAQKEYRVAKSTGHLKLNLNRAIIEGYDGNEIIFSGKSVQVEEVDERAKGLLPISSSGNTDNTGMGISVLESAQEIRVKVVAKDQIGLITIKVPQNMKVSIINNTNYFIPNKDAEQGELLIKNLKNEIEVLTNNNKIKLENNTGPMNVRTVYGSIEALLNGDIKGPISIISAHDFVDVTMPANTKANIELGTSSGKLYAAKEFKIDIDKTETPTTLTSMNGYTFATTSKDKYQTPSAVKITGTGVAKGSNNATGVTVLTGVNVNVNTQDSVNAININGVQVKPAVGEVIVKANGKKSELQTVTIGYAIKAGEKIKGKLNGGGIELIFKSSDKNVYLREQ